MKTELCAIKRERFDPTNLEHLKSYQRFVTEGRWGDIQFFASNEHPTVPSHVSHVFEDHFLKLAIEQLSPEESAPESGKTN